MAIRLVKSLCQEDLQEEIEGNLIEYRSLLNPASKWSTIKYWLQVFTYLRPSTMKNISQNSKYYVMFEFNILLTLRNLWKHRSTSILNLGGFTLGTLCVSLLYFYIKGELSYDNFHHKSDEIYRVIRVSAMNGEKYKIGVTSNPFADHLKLDFPGMIQSAVRVGPEDALVSYEDKVFKEDNIVMADENFFTFFSFPLIAGNPESALSNPNSIVLTKKSAQKYFGFDDPIGKTLVLDNEYQFIVTGIVGDLPSKSHLEFDFVGSRLFYGPEETPRWWNNGLATYLRIENPEHAIAMQKQFPAFIDKHFAKWIEKSNKRVDITLEKFDDIYFNHDIRYDWVKHGNLNTIYLLGAVAVAILFIACFNYLNLAIAHSFQRAKEIGIRKVLGGNKIRIVLQFLGESFMIAFFAIALAIGLTELILPSFNNYFELSVSTTWLDSAVLSFFAAMLLVTMILSGLYPALLLSSFNPISVFKGKLRLGKVNLLLRKSLVIAQFAISIFMIITTLLIGRQLDFVNNKSLGFAKEAIVMIDMDNREIRSQRENFKERLKLEAGILNVTSMSGEPGGFHDATTVHFLGGIEPTRMRTCFVDPDYLKTFDIQLLAGRDFSRQFHMNDAHATVINARAAERLGLTPEEVIGKKFKIGMWDTLTHVIVGVTDNYNFLSLKDQVEPLLIAQGNYHRRVGIKLNPEQLMSTLDKVQSIYDELAPNYPMTYEFIDDSLNNLYQDEIKQSRIFQTFSGISLFLACLGIFGLVSFAVEKRRKEFGIRKALGAGIPAILRLISNEFMLMIGMATFIAIPCAWYLINSWLDGFAYRINLLDSWTIFIVGAIVAFILALVTIFVRSLRAASANPTESLRYE